MPVAVEIEGDTARLRYLYQVNTEFTWALRLLIAVARFKYCLAIFSYWYPLSVENILANGIRRNTCLLKPYLWNFHPIVGQGWTRVLSKVSHAHKNNPDLLRKTSTLLGVCSSRNYQLRQCRCHTTNHNDVYCRATCWAPTVGSSNRSAAQLLLRIRHSPAFARPCWRDNPEGNSILAKLWTFGSLGYRNPNHAYLQHD